MSNEYVGALLALALIDDNFIVENVRVPKVNNYSQFKISSKVYDFDFTIGKDNGKEKFNELVSKKYPQLQYDKENFEVPFSILCNSFLENFTTMKYLRLQRANAFVKKWCDENNFICEEYLASVYAMAFLDQMNKSKGSIVTSRNIRYNVNRINKIVEESSEEFFERFPWVKDYPKLLDKSKVMGFDDVDVARVKAIALTAALPKMDFKLEAEPTAYNNLEFVAWNKDDMNRVVENVFDYGENREDTADELLVRLYEIILETYGKSSNIDWFKDKKTLIKHLEGKVLDLVKEHGNPDTFMSKLWKLSKSKQGISIGRDRKVIDAAILTLSTMFGTGFAMEDNGINIYNCPTYKNEFDLEVKNNIEYAEDYPDLVSRNVQRALNPDKSNNDATILKEDIINDSVEDDEGKDDMEFIEDTIEMLISTGAIREDERDHFRKMMIESLRQFEDFIQEIDNELIEGKYPFEGEGELNIDGMIGEIRRKREDSAHKNESDIVEENNTDNKTDDTEDSEEFNM